MFITKKKAKPQGITKNFRKTLKEKKKFFFLPVTRLTLVKGLPRLYKVKCFFIPPGTTP